MSRNRASLTVNDPLTKAVKDGDIKAVEQYLSKYPDHVNLKDRNGSTTLFTAAYFGKFEVAQVLLKFGADVNITNLRDNTAIDMAIIKDRIDIIKLLLKHGAHVDVSKREISNKLTANKIARETIENWIEKQRREQQEHIRRMQYEVELEKQRISKLNKPKTDFNPKQVVARPIRKGAAHFRVFCSINSWVTEIACGTGNQSFGWLGTTACFLYNKYNKSSCHSSYPIAIFNNDNILLLPNQLINERCSDSEKVYLHISNNERSINTIWSFLAFTPLDAYVPIDFKIDTSKCILAKKYEKMDVVSTKNRAILNRNIKNNSDNISIKPSLHVINKNQPEENNYIDCSKSNSTPVIIAELNSFGKDNYTSQSLVMNKVSENIFEVSTALPRGLCLYFVFLIDDQYVLSNNHEIVGQERVDNNCCGFIYSNKISIPTILYSDIKTMKDSKSKEMISSVALNNENAVNCIFDNLFSDYYQKAETNVLNLE